MAALRSSQHPLRFIPFHPPSLSSSAAKSHRIKKFHSRKATKAFLADVSGRFRVLPLRCSAEGEDAIRRSNQARENELVGESDRPPFDLNLAVVLAGFAFEAYLSPPKNVGKREIDAADCQTVFLSEMFLREVYDGQLFIKLKNGVDFPAMDPWVEYKSFDEIDEEKQWWRIPFVSDLLMKSSLGSALKVALGYESVNARQFVESAFGQLKSLNYSYLQKVRSSDDYDNAIERSGESLNTVAGSKQILKQESSKGQQMTLVDLGPEKENNSLQFDGDSNGSKSPLERERDVSQQSDEFFWKNLADSINQTVLQKLGFSIPETLRWDGFDLLNRISMQSQRIAEEEYVESGLATPGRKDDVDSTNALQYTTNGIQSSFFDIKKASQDLQSQTDNILGALMVLSATFSQQKKDVPPVVGNENKNDSSSTGTEGVTQYSMNVTGGITLEGSALDGRKTEEMKALFSTAESAMEAWAMLATSLGRTSFIKSEFEKICFLDNVSTDTQVAIWRDTLQRRLVIAFRGTEQAKWKDIRTDLMIVPAGLNPERLGGDFKREVQVHSGFLGAYDSVRNRIMTLIKLAIGYFEDGHVENLPNWHVYVTGHSLGGALATLLALELSSSRMAKCSVITVTMYNFGSPRVGNKRFTDIYNEKVKDSWRIVNHRDIIPTVPRLMGYCHVAQPVYLAAGELRDALVNMEHLGDGYQGDVIGQSTPDVLVSEFMKGEKQLIEKILQTEINLFRTIRDGTALMQHMEDFYYITLLESVRSNYRTVESSDSNGNDSSPTA